MDFEKRLQHLTKAQERELNKPNEPEELSNGIFNRYKNPVLTAASVPLHWRYDLNPSTNPFLMERLGINSVFNAGAVKWNGRYLLICRVEGSDRKSFFAVAESSTGIDRFKFWKYPVVMPETDEPDTNVYDMRITMHEDGWIYGLFCTERKDTSVSEYDQSAAIARCGIARTRDLKTWQRLSDLKTSSPQQRNVVLHPEFVNGRYAFYTRPQDGFIETGKGGGIAFGLSDSIENAEIIEETIIDKKVYHTIYEAKNGQGPAPIKTEHGWLHLAHGVRNTAAGLRYVLYMFMTALDDLTRVIYKPAGYLIAPEGEERIGDVSNVVFCNGWIADEDGKVFIYYASSDTRMHVATSTIERLTDYVMNTAPDGLSSAKTVKRIIKLIDHNQSISTAEV